MMISRREYREQISLLEMKARSLERDRERWMAEAMVRAPQIEQLGTDLNQLRDKQRAYDSLAGAVSRIELLRDQWRAAGFDTMADALVIALGNEEKDDGDDKSD